MSPSNRWKSSIKPFKLHKSLLQSKLADFGTDLQVSLQEIFQQYQNGLLSAARQQELAGQSLLDQAQKRVKTCSKR